MIASLLIANRGEIACRIIRTARRLGIRTVAVYSDADAQALHVRRADAAVHIGASPARESYLVGERIIAAARQTGAEAIHPGYGFLSENADFAQAVIEAGLVWLGPRPDSIRAMGLKDAAKARMIAAGVAVTPGYLGADQSPERLRAEADAIGYPVLIKAVAGGGGKGMRRVDAGGDFADALAACRREAAAAFGDDRVLIEKYILSPRHIEVQVFGDTHGNVVHLFERDCSLQRRHQKVIEEAPAPGMDAATRAAVCAAAVKAARAVDYVGAGTIEFVADASDGLRADRIWFMEMNTRLQVEHPVTEAITGVDLVEWQLRIASGEPLPKRQDELAIDGHAIEARLYAEDPANGFLPSIGRLDWLALPVAEGDDARFVLDRSVAAGVRVDTGVARGDAIGVHYDPMIAKVVAHAADRAGAVARLRDAIRETSVYPVRTNAGFLARTLAVADFADGAVDTGFIARHLDAITARPPIPAAARGLAARLLANDHGHGTGWTIHAPGALRSGGWSVWRQASGFRLNGPARRTVWVEVDGVATEADLGAGDASMSQVIAFDEGVLVAEGGETYRVTLPRAGGAQRGAVAVDGTLLAPMPGRVIAVEFAAGERVAKGARLVTLEAMKMEHALTAPFDGIVAELAVAAGGQVSEGALLVRIVAEEGAAEVDMRSFRA